MTKKTNGLRLLIYFILTCWAILQLYPLFFMMINSVKTNAEYVTDTMALPKAPTLENYIYAWRGASGETVKNYSALKMSGNMATAFRNSFFVTAVGLVMLCTVSTMAGYAQARLDFRGRTKFYTLIVWMLAIPGQALLIPIFRMCAELKLTNNLLLLSILYATFALPSATITMKANLEAIPHEIEEAASLDGCNKWMTFWHVVLPMSKGLIATIAVLNMNFMWSELMYANVLMTKNEARTISSALVSLMASQFNYSPAGLMAGVAITSLPILILYSFCQSKIMKSMTAGAIKE